MYRKIKKKNTKKLSKESENFKKQTGKAMLVYEIIVLIVIHMY